MLPHRLKLFTLINLRKNLTWKSIIIFIISSWLIRYLLTIFYCFLLHNLIFRWTTCPTENNRPKNFSDLDRIGGRGGVIEKYASEPSSCDDDRSDIFDPRVIKILIFIPIHVLNFERRQTIRETWAKPFRQDSIVDFDLKKLETKFIFVVGSISARESLSVSMNKGYDRRLNEEFIKYKDVLRLNDVIDNYYNITIKIKSILDWTLKRCPRIQYVVRADSDIVLNYSNLLRFLFWLNETRRQSNNDDLIAGYCRAHDCVTRWPQSKTCLPRTVYDSLLKSSPYKGACFVPRYCFGFSYVLSRTFIEKALNVWSGGQQRFDRDHRNNILNSYWPLDDIYLTGFLADSIETYIPRLNYPYAFTYQRKFDTFSCYENGVVASAGYENDEEMRRRWTRRLNYCGHR